MPGLVGWALVCVLVAGLLTWLVRVYALQRGLLDTPGARRSHQIPTPRGGGIAIAVVVLGAVGWLLWIFSGQRLALGLFGAGLLLVAGIGWLDDHRSLPALPRFGVHLLAATLLAASLWAEGLVWWQILVGWVLAVSLVNIWNFMDGLNGLATSQAALGAAGFACVLPMPWAWVAWAVCAACLGFLPFNFPHARIFLGDVGSGVLGYLMAGLAALSVSRTESPFLPLLPLVVFCIDAGFTLLRRVLLREAWWQPHTSHAYQRAARRLGHTRVTLSCALFTAAATIVMLIAWMVQLMTGLGIVVFFCALASLTWMQQTRNSLQG